jgi:thiamine-monophosphate kinase
VDAVPRSAILRSQAVDLQRQCTLSGGDDYELVFTAPASRAAEVESISQRLNLPVQRIGRTEAQPGLRLVDSNGEPVEQAFESFDHFRKAPDDLG